MLSAESDAAPAALRQARLPKWLLPASWPCQDGSPALADLTLHAGRIATLVPSQGASGPGDEPAWDLAGAPVLPTFVDAHTHLDCAFTRHRIAALKPGLLGGIAGKAADRPRWSEADLRARAARALSRASEAGTTLLRSHVDWQDADMVPTAWRVLGELARSWAPRLRLERVSLCHPRVHPDHASAQRLARQVAASGSGARLGGFIHTSNWSPEAIRHLVHAAADHGLDLDLHVDEELDSSAQGLRFVAELLADMRFAGTVVCGHNCALAAQPEAQALATLDAVARAPITLVSLPQNNLYLQDAETGRTPRLRGLTLLKEARARGIPLLIASDSVQDPFCPVGSFDPLESFAAGVLAGQLDDAFDCWTDTICRADWLGPRAQRRPMAVGDAADLVIFTAATAHAWPSRTAERIVMRGGQISRSQPPLPSTTPSGGPSP
jgi:cytosine deaminase